MQTIIFLSGFAVPNWLAKTRFIWNKSMWKNYNCVFLSSKTPISDSMVERELDQLNKLTQSFSSVVLAGQSLGAWWAANLVSHTNSKIEKLVLWTPLGNTLSYPIFNVSTKYHPEFKSPKNNLGPTKTLLVPAKNDFVVPRYFHADLFQKIFDPMVYTLDGGHFYQKNHQAGLDYMKDWIEFI